MFLVLTGVREQSNSVDEECKLTTPVQTDCFDFQFRVRASVTPLVVNCPSFDDTFSSKLLPALEDAMTKGIIPVKALVFTNPHNPLAQCYSRTVLEDCLRFCEQRNLHFISDEVYAMSTIEPDTSSKNLSPFVSILSCDSASVGCSPRRVHAIWSISMEFGSSGIRLVCAHSPPTFWLSRAELISLARSRAARCPSTTRK